MDPILLTRSQMAMSLGFHIVFASVGIAMPVLMVVAEIQWRRTRDAVWLELAQRWAKGTAVLFAIGAVSGTVLSFELGLLFPEFMRHAGPLIGLPFSLEGFAFFTEAIFLGIFLYGRERVKPALHIAASVVVALSGLASAVFVTLVNAFMNAPRGFTVENGRFTGVDPIAAMTSPYAPHEVVHSVLAAYMATGLAVAGVHAFALLRDRASILHRRALTVALMLAIPCSLAQPLVGHVAGQRVAKFQPAKLAATEGLRKTQARAPVSIGPIEIPGLLSFMAFSDFDAVVRGLDDFPKEDQPPAIVRPAFQIMVGLGTLAAGYAAWMFLLLVRRRLFDSRRALLATVMMAPAGFLALEAGWVVTEVGRQPWVIYGVIRTADAATTASGQGFRFAVFALVYLLLAGVVLAVLRRHIRSTLAQRTPP